MCVLPDWMIKAYVQQKRIMIDPFEEANVQPASYDFRLGNKFLFLGTDGVGVYRNVGELSDHLTTEVREQKQLFLPPGASALGLTKEYFGLNDVVGAKVYTKSGIGRLFVATATDAGWWDPGFHGYGVLELKNNGELPVSLLAGQRIGQIVFETLAGPCDQSYNGTFQDQQDFAVDRWKRSLRKLVSEVEDAKGETPVTGSERIPLLTGT